MAIGMFFFIVLIIGVVVVVGSAAGAYAMNRNGQDRSLAASQRAEIKQARVNEAIACKALRSIANGAGNPILEAGEALDRINNNEIKELN